MFSPGGQLDLHTFAGLRGGGGKGGGGQQNDQFASRPITLVDPVNGKAFTQETNPYLLYMQPNHGQGPSAQEQLNAEIADRQAQEKAASDAAAAKSTADAATAETNFQGNRQTAYNDALAAVQRRFQLEGVDPASYMTTDIQPALQRQFNSIQDLDPNPSAAFPTSLADTILGNVTSGKRTQALNTLNSTFTPTYTQNLIPDSTTDSFVNDILNDQFNPLSQQLDNAQKRGTLSPAGFSAASDLLGQKRAAAASTVHNLGQGIVDTDRTGLNDLITGARNSASNLTLGQNFDPTSFFGQAAGKAQSDLSNFGGALRTAVGDTKFADIQDLINAGGAVQGVGNPTAANPLGPGGVVPPDPLAEQKRGLGNTGAF